MKGPSSGHSRRHGVRIQEGDIQSIEDAITAYRYALAEFDQNGRFIQSAKMHRQLGTAWLTLGDVLYERGERDNQAQFLHRTVTAYRTVLNEYTRGSAPPLPGKDSTDDHDQQMKVSTIVDRR